MENKDQELLIRVYRDDMSDKIYAELISEVCSVFGVGTSAASAVGHLLQQIGYEYMRNDEESAVATKFINLVS